MNKHDRAFVATVMQFYKSHGRHTLPWRQTADPYRILVSEIMLQQTQVERVIPKYEAFITRWPTVQALAKASLAEVLIAWQGLGYNRRAKLLHTCARVIVDELHGSFPTTYDGLRALPGVGPYTAGAIMAFAYDEPVPIIETNVRTVYLHHFFPRLHDVPDAAILKLVVKHLPAVQPRNWYAALMDYGSHLKKVAGPIHRRSKSYLRQHAFRGSDREIRGAIMRLLALRPHPKRSLVRELQRFESSRIEKALAALTEEGLLSARRGRYALPED